MRAETSGGGGGRTQQTSLHHHIVGGDLKIADILVMADSCHFEFEKISGHIPF